MTQVMWASLLSVSNAPSAPHAAAEEFLLSFRPLQFSVPVTPLLADIPLHLVRVPQQLPLAPPKWEQQFPLVPFPPISTANETKRLKNYSLNETTNSSDFSKTFCLQPRFAALGLSGSRAQAFFREPAPRLSIF